MSPLKADLSDLPRAEPERVEGLAPDEKPRFVQLLAERWAETSDDNKPTALGTRFRHSDAGKCARALGYTAVGLPASDPMDLTGVWNTSLGTLLHEAWQEALQAAFPDAAVETKCQVEDFDGSGHIDAVIETKRELDPGDEALLFASAPLDLVDSHMRAGGLVEWTVAYELKTIGGFGFKAAIGKARRGTPAEGPKTEHLIQASLNGLAVDADEVVIGYLAKECISVNAAGKLNPIDRFAAEWTFTREQYEPIARAEVARVSGILGLVDDGTLPARKIPDLGKHAEITNPATGQWTETDGDKVLNVGSYWGCNYCKYQTICATTEAGRIPVEAVKP